MHRGGGQTRMGTGWEEGTRNKGPRKVCAEGSGEEGRVAVGSALFGRRFGPVAQDVVCIELQLQFAFPVGS